MKFYSEKLDKMFDSIGELDKAEKQDEICIKQGLNRIHVLEDDIKEIEEELEEIEQERKDLIEEMMDKKKEIIETKKKMNVPLTQEEIDANKALGLLDIFQQIFGKALDDEEK